MIQGSVGANGHSRPEQVEILMPDDDDLNTSIYRTNHNELSQLNGSRQADEKISFFSSPTQSSSSSPSQRRSPVNTPSSGDDSSAPVIRSNHYRTIPQFGIPYPINLNGALDSTNSEKYKELKEKKKKKETRQEKKKYVNTFKVEANGTDSYDVEGVLQSLGELQQVGKKPNRKATKNVSTQIVNGLTNGERKGRKQSNEKQDDDKKSSSENENEDAETASESGGVDNSIRDYSSTLEFNHIQKQFSRNVALVEESVDLRRQVSRSIENLSSFTEVTKKQKRKKKISDETTLPQQQQQQQQRPVKTQSYVGSRSRLLNGTGVNGELPISNESNTSRPDPPITARSANASLPNWSKNPLVHSRSVDGGGNVKKLVINNHNLSTDLDMAVDFPPLLDEHNSAGTVDPVWPILKQTLPNLSSAVIENKTSSDTDLSTPQQTTVQGTDLPNDFNPKAGALDDASPINQTNRDGIPDTNQGPENVKSQIEPNINGSPEPIITDHKISDNVQSDAIEPVFDHQTPVSGFKDTSKLSFSKINGPVTFYEESEDNWSTDITFGFDVNQELLVSSLGYPTNLSFQVNPDPSCFNLDKACNDLQFNISPESGICLDQQPQFFNQDESIEGCFDSGASSLTDQASPDDDSELEDSPIAFNYYQIIKFLKDRWILVAAELAKDDKCLIRYYQQQQPNVVA